MTKLGIYTPSLSATALIWLEHNSCAEQCMADSWEWDGSRSVAEDMEHGTPGLLVVGQVLQVAAEELAGLEDARAHLKVRSGEHLAAIFLCGLFGCMPSAFDHDGGPDLVFDSHPEESWFPFGSPAAFEIKSLPGAYRKKLSVLESGGASDVDVELPFDLRLWSAAEVMRDAHPTLVRAAQSLVAKTPLQYSRNIFLITHPFDHFALDVAQSRTAGHCMPEIGNYDGVDSIWVYWPPDKLVMWSAATRAWIDIIFVANPEEQFLDEQLSFIQNVELVYIFAAGIEASPYLFNIKLF
jgi:hypothetical protein